MPILEFAIACQSSSIDQRTNAVSLFNIIDSLEVSRRPNESLRGALVEIPFEFVSSWRKEPSDSTDVRYRQVLTFITPDGIEDEISITDFSLEHLRYRVHAQLPPMSITEGGEYTIRVELQLNRGNNDSPDVLFTSEYIISIHITDLPIVITLTNEELETLSRPLAGSGGFQSLLSRIQNQIFGQTLVLSAKDGERLVRYTTRYGSGGFQSRLSRVVEQVAEQMNRPT